MSLSKQKVKAALQQSRITEYAAAKMGTLGFHDVGCLDFF
jgi:hypothetical protein